MSRAFALLGGLLRQVSRSFYLSVRVLPAEVREPIALAYLLARAADTVADTAVVPRAERLHHLDTLRRCFAGAAPDVAAVLRACAPHQKTAVERRLLEGVGEAVALLAGLPEQDAVEVRAVLDTLTAGMVLDLTRFPGDDVATLGALQTLEELDEYTYLVAGCVGPFWTAIHRTHRRRLRRWAPGEMSALSVRFGKALQLTNVLRDVPGDLRRGRCYLPAKELAALGLRPPDLLEAAGAARGRPLVDRLLELALEHYDAGWRYTLAIPRAEWRMRLACAWPLLIGVATLARLSEHPNPLAASPPVKVPRSAVRAIVARSTLNVWSNGALARDADQLRRRVRL
jgi:farnesyl-diphosphate farnesyltransferase